MSSGDASNFAPTKWAQRKDLLLVTFCVEDCKDTDVKFESNKILFEGQGGAMNKKYKTELELFKEIEPKDCRWEATSRYVFIHAQKKESGPFWPRLLNSKIKQHWLKVDFDKMKDEDDSTDDDDDILGAGQQQQPDLSQLMAQMGKGPGMMDLGDMDNDDQDSDDSDDEELPELETAPKETESKPKENGSTESAAEPQACDA